METGATTSKKTNTRYMSIVELRQRVLTMSMDSKHGNDQGRKAGIKALHMTEELAKVKQRLRDLEARSSNANDLVSLVTEAEAKGTGESAMPPCCC